MEGTQQKYLYTVIKEEKQEEDGKSYYCAGICLKIWHQDETAQAGITRYIKDISTNAAAVCSLVNQMNQSGLDPIHFYDIVEDFCQNENRIL